MPDKRLAQQIAGGRIGFPNPAATVQHDDTARQGFQKQFETVGEAFLFGELAQTFGTGGGQLGVELRHALLQLPVRAFQLYRHLVERQKGILQLPRTSDRLSAHRLACSCCCCDDGFRPYALDRSKNYADWCVLL